MSEDQVHVLLSNLARIEERIETLRRELLHHTKEEHKEFKEALEEGRATREAVAEIQTTARVARWIATAVAGVAGFAVWAMDHFKFKG